MDSRIVQVVGALILCVVYCGCEYNASNLQTRPKPIWNLTYTDRLKQDLLLNYDKFARPAQHYNLTTVEIGITVHHIDIDEFKSTFIVHSWIHLYWKDDKLKWKPSDYGGLRHVNFAEHEIWQPDIMLYNSALGSPASHPTGTHCVVKDTGNVIWIPAAKLSALCELDLKYWPFDTQKCTLKFGSWTYDGFNLDLQLLSSGALVIDEEFIPGDWDIIKTNFSRHSKIYACCEEPYPDTEFEFVIARMSSAYKDTIVALAFVIIGLTLLVFWLPPQAGEKILLNGFVAVVISMFLIYFSQKVPVGIHMPLVVLFYSKSLYMVGFSMVESIAVIWISRTLHNKSLPASLRKLLTGSVGNLLCLRQLAIKGVSTQNDNTSTDGTINLDTTELENKPKRNDTTITDCTLKNELQEEWLLLANAIDRVAFILYSILFIILALVYSL